MRARTSGGLIRCRTALSSCDTPVAESTAATIKTARDHLPQMNSRPAAATVIIAITGVLPSSVKAHSTRLQAAVRAPTTVSVTCTSQVTSLPPTATCTAMMTNNATRTATSVADGQVMTRDRTDSPPPAASAVTRPLLPRAGAQSSGSRAWPWPGCPGRSRDGDREDGRIATLLREGGHLVHRSRLVGVGADVHDLHAQPLPKRSSLTSSSRPEGFFLRTSSAASPNISAVMWSGCMIMSVHSHSWAVW